MSSSSGPSESQPLTGGSVSSGSGSSRQAGAGRVLGHASTRLCTLLCVGALLWTSLQRVLQTDTSSCAHTLASECFRLGLAWPLANVALSAALLVRLALQPWERLAAANGEAVGLALRLHDNRARVGWLGAGASLAACINALAALARQHAGPLAAYWASDLALWAAAGLLTVRQTLAVQSGTQPLPAAAPRPLFPAVLVFALAAHACMALADGFCMAVQPGGAAGGWPGRVAGGALSLGALLASLSAHRTAFVLPRGARQPGDEGEQAADGAAYATALSREKAEHVPLVRTPERAASVLGTLTFAWVTPILRLGTQTTIDSGDLYMLDSADRPLSIWRSYVACRRPGRSLLRTLLATFAGQLLAQVLLALAGAVLAYAGPFFLQRILRAIREGERGSAVYVDAAGLLLSSMLHSLASNQVLWLGRKVSLRLQSLLVAELSSRALQRRSKSAGAPADKAAEGDSSSSSSSGGKAEAEDEEKDRTAGSDGRMANMLTSDLESVGHIASYLDEIYTLPIGFVIGAWYLHRLLGTAALIGLAITVIYYPLTKLMVKYLIKYQRRLMALDDERVTMITEMFQGIRAVKLFGWQSRFVARVRAKRDEEIAAYWTLIFLQLPVSFVRSLTTSLILVAILAIHTLAFGRSLTADVVFPAITVFSMVSSTFNRIPGLFSWMSSCYVSLTRIESFMTQAHVQDLGDRVLAPQCGSVGDATAIGFVNATMVWSETPASAEPEASAEPSLHDASLDAAASTAAASVECQSEASDGASEATPLLAPGGPTRTPSYAALPGSPGSPVSPSSTLAMPSAAKAKHAAGMPGFSLTDVTLLFPTGALSIVVGPTGSGKSSLLAALIGEMTLTAGRIVLPTSDALSADARLAEVARLSRQGLMMADVAYVAQEAWLRNATIRENILFGQPYQAARYEEVLRVCALKPDLRILAAGDMTEIGERGVTLSGGQKQRVALARAVYSDRRILLIDDCLSAVDAHTGKHILNACLLGKTPLMHGRTRVLVTHHVAACLKHCEYVAVMREGRVALSGAPQELRRLGHFADESISEEPADDASEAAQSAGTSAGVNDMQAEDAYNAARRESQPGEAAADGALVDDEEREQGYVRPAVWLGYMRMCGSPVYWLAVLLFILLSRGVSILQDYWVRLWMAADPSSSFVTTRSVVSWLGCYVLLGMLSTLVRLAAMVNENVGGMRAGRKYHEVLFTRVMNASPRFFDKTPIGRVISRFSRDMRTIDDSIIGYISILFAQIMQVASVFAIITSVTPPFVLIALVMSAAYAVLAIYYLNATRELKRLDAISMAPLLSLFSELITGVESIRAFGAQNQYTMEAMHRIDTHNRPYYLMWAANRWLCTRIEFSGCIVAFSTTLLILLTLDSIDAALAGFVLMYAISFSDNMLWFIRNYSECEISMNAVERVNQYLRIEQEAEAFAKPENRPPESWPASGVVEVKDLVVEYVPGAPVLHGISLAARHGEKIGVVGRTGAGKSTLSLAFLRFIEAASGSIVVDGIDIATVGLEELRRSFTIIPQDPVLFNGSIRFNLDPFAEYPDELLWDALKRSHLVRDNALADSSALPSPSATQPPTPLDADIVEGGTAGQLDRMAGIFSSLDNEIKENGQNLSLGQRQLVALARALVRRSRLIIMDEATASVDFDTDDRIQRTIRGPEFANSTLFCIAHRLRTIIDYDRVLVLDKGGIEEFDTPWNLLQKEEGLFKSMCEKTGEYERLYAIAKAKTEKALITMG
ncbi:hypothetical protein LPJ53_003318 [Coemansia erecta]|uniref:P-loop containing nucleoside triphosphate hydrolase protein n=1 Tax=Coemansia erecta TaxID=147472 RepID=A0A9W8CQB1_9FUNG|nr:hypothetical protein LPJ53_003318 [Coemansia erecta]